MDRQIEKLARQMRDEGVPPPRDLWPEIEARLEEPAGSRRFRPTERWWRLATVAAALVLLIASGTLVQGPSPDTEVAALAGRAPEAAPGGAALLQMMNQAIGELEAAQASDPANTNLSRLTVLAHKGRADLLRATTTRRTL